MKYEEIVNYVRESIGSVDASEYDGHLAVQFNVVGEGEGAFYVELKDGKINVEPYEYYDRDVIFTLTAESLVAIIDGKLDSVKAYQDGQLEVSSIPAALKVKKLIDDVNSKKKATPKAKKVTKPVADTQLEIDATSKTATEPAVNDKVEEPKAEKTTTKKATATKKATTKKTATKKATTTKTKKASDK